MVKRNISILSMANHFACIDHVGCTSILGMSWTSKHRRPTCHSLHLQVYYYGLLLPTGVHEGTVAKSTTLEYNDSKLQKLVHELFRRL